MPRTLDIQNLHIHRNAFIAEFVKLYELLIADNGSLTEEQEDRYRDMCITAGREFRELSGGFTCGVRSGYDLVFTNDAYYYGVYREGIEEMTENTFDDEIQEKFDDALCAAGVSCLYSQAGIDDSSIGCIETLYFLAGLEEGAATRFGWLPDYALSDRRVAELAELARFGRAADGHVAA